MEVMEHKLCRLCCRNEAISDIFHEDPYGLRISEKIMHCCTKICIKREDGLPPHICDDCERELDACYRFILKCEASDEKLRSQSVGIISQVIIKSDDYEPPIDVKTEITCGSDDDFSFDDPFSDDIPLEQLQQNISLNQFEDTFVIKLENAECEVRKRGPYKKRVHKSEVTVKRKPYKKKIKYSKSAPTCCSVCGRDCKNPSALVTHMKSHSNQYKFPCSVCDRKYKEKGSLKRHMDKKHQVQVRTRTMICEICGKGFYSKTDVKVHLRTHTGETPYSCTVCSARFTQIGALIRHKKMHTGERDHLCSICPKRFFSKQDLKRHLHTHSTEKKFHCTLCNILFKHKANLKKHSKLHTEDCTYICDYCGRTFKFKGNLKLHIKRLHSEKSGFCELCSKYFPNLEAHSWKHTGERPLKCELCPCSFFERKGLSRHVNFKHKRTEQYKCEVEGCTRKFPARSMLTFHIAKIHSTIIPFSCDQCSRGFYRKSDLARHKIGTHKEKLC